MPSAKRSGEARWADALEEIFADNKETATDFAGLEASIAGHQTLRERLDDLALKIRLCQAESDRPAARHALEHFCQSGDESALRLVEWLFLQTPADRRSASQGLKGLLIARKIRAERVDPRDKLARETWTLLERLAGEDVRESGAVRQFVEDWKTRSAHTSAEAMGMADILQTLAAGAVPPVSPTLGPIFDRVLASPDRSAHDLERLARSWEKLSRPDADAPVVADSVLLGLVQLSYARLREQRPVGDLYRLTDNRDGPCDLVLTAAVEGERAALTVKADDSGDQARTQIHDWLLNKVRPLYFDQNGALEDEDADEAITLAVDSVWRRTSTPFGMNIEIPIPVAVRTW